jgi:hypothetical protein
MTVDKLVTYHVHIDPYNIKRDNILLKRIDPIVK